MNSDETDKPISARQRPIRDLNPTLLGYSHAGARAATACWRAVRHKLEDPVIDRSAMDIRLREQRRAFAIETG